MTSTITAPAATIRAGLYQRVSTTDQDTKRQHAANRAAAAQHGWAVTEYTDDGLSASMFAKRTGKRAGGAARKNYRRMVQDIATGQLDLIVVHDVSRASRELEGWAPLLGQCRRAGVQVFVTRQDEQYDLSKPTHWQQLASAGTQAEMESLVKSAQIRSGKAFWASQGLPVSGTAPFGVKRVNDPDKAKHRWLRDEPHPETGPVARRIVLAVGAGASYADIARQLDSEHIPTPGRSARWDHSMIVKIAGHPGLVSAGVVTEAQHLAARERIQRTKGTGRGGGSKAAVHRYSSVMVCAQCGATVRGAARGGQAIYRGICGHVSIPAAEADRWIDALCIDRLARPDYADLFATGGDQAAAQQARTEARRLRAQLADWLAVLDSPAEYAAKKAQLQPAIAAAERRATEAATPSALAGLPDADRDVVAARWEALTVAARKDAVRWLAPRAQLRHGKRGAGRTPVNERVILWP
jgi:site-specific DNA recombinase